MRVLHIGKFFPPHPGGIERSASDLCAGLQTRGVAAAVLAHAEPGSGTARFRSAAGVQVTLAACHGRLLYAPISPGFPWLLQRLIGEFRPDLLHLHVPNTSAFFALLSPAARRLPWIVHWHADIPHDSRRRLLRLAYRAYRPWEQALLRRAAAIIATSAAYRDSSPALARWREKIHVIPLGIPPLPDASASPSHSPRSISPPQAEIGSNPSPSRLTVQDDADGSTGAAPSTSARLRILAVGRLSYFKGIDVLLRAVAEIPDARLTIVGDGECRATLERLARELRISARVHFIGRVAMDDAGAAALAHAYADTDVFCLPSTDRAESFGLVLLEAMRARLPVVASAIAGSGVGYVVSDGATGLLVPPGNASALASALRRLAADPALRAQLGAAGAQRWRDEFTLDRVVDRVLDLYRQLLRSDAVRAAASPAESRPPG